MDKIIGIVGGVGPYAGVDLVTKILNLTKAGKDQDHLPLVLMSLPGLIHDRTAFLLGETDVNPAYAISRIIMKLQQVGADVAGIPCNTAHAPSIFNLIQAELVKNNCRIKLLNMIEEVVAYIIRTYPNVGRIGVLSTNGVYQTRIYQNILEKIQLQ